ncbi:MAG: hypothetical protein GY785_20345 [Gammaproteobacteria bacterium]|nr:hypothetical protein [Gammaproteobacteria bacterium]
MKRLGEILAYAVFAGIVGLLSVWPRYEMVDQSEAIISLTFSHAGKRIGECRILTQEDLNKLPPNMRKPSDCPRERHPIRIELRSGETVLYDRILAPSGIWSDGKANVYRRVVIPAGSHAIFVGMNDSGGDREFDYEAAANVDVVPGRNVVIRFDEQLQQFSIR